MASEQMVEKAKAFYDNYPDGKVSFLHLMADFHEKELAAHAAAQSQEIERLNGEIERLKKQALETHKDHQRELRDAIRSAVAEESWANRQGGDYGSY